MPAQENKQKNQGSKSEGASAKVPSEHKIVKDGWDDSRTNFQASYGLKMTPEDLEDGSAIMKAFQDADRENQQKKK